MKVWKAIVGTAAVVAVAGAIGLGVNSWRADQEQQRLEVVEQAEQLANEKVDSLNSKWEVRHLMEPAAPAEAVAPAEPAPETIVDPVEEADPVQPAPPAPRLCPPGYQANGSDGYNDTSCFPEICFNISVPDAAHPECEVALVP